MDASDMAECNYEFGICIPKNGQIHIPEMGERIRIQWQSMEGYPANSDNVTVIDPKFTDYVMLVRVGWIGNNPQLMAFPNIIIEYENRIPIVREWNGIPWNYRGYQTPVIPTPADYDINAE
jgi:hypothetical protein